MEPVSLAKRNLFGISLNHDQLRNDLIEMSRDQLSVQSQRWNFDFETLKPLEENPRFEWNKLTIKKPILAYDSDQSEMAFSSFASHEIESELEREHEEEDDEALAMPAFYQMQRVQKMKENKFSIKQFVQIGNKTTAAGSLSAKQENKTVKKKKKSTKKRSTNPQLIITFSENRKDTLRSSKTTNTKPTSSTSSSTSSSTITTSTETPMKQTSILSKLFFI